MTGIVGIYFEKDSSTNMITSTDSVREILKAISAARSLERALAAVLAEDGIRVDQWRAMDCLATAPGMLMGEIAEHLVMPPATTTRLIDELTDSGFVFRRPEPDDKRKAVVYLSRTGHERLARVTAVLQSHAPELMTKTTGSIVREPPQV